MTRLPKRGKLPWTLTPWEFRTKRPKLELKIYIDEFVFGPRLNYSNDFFCLVRQCPKACMLTMLFWEILHQGAFKSMESICIDCSLCNTYVSLAGWRPPSSMARPWMKCML